MLQPKISIIVPCYNQAQYLDECLKSVMDQDFVDWECLIINDGSNDSTGKIAQQWIEKDPRFTYLKKENGGVASARNLGLEKSRGKYILPLDGDDKIGNEYLQKSYDKLEEGFDLVYCNAEYFGSKEGRFSYGDYSFSDLLRYNMIFVSAVFRIDRRNMILFDENFRTGFEDWEFWISYLKNNDKKVFKLEDSLFYYRISESSRNADIIGDSQKTSAAKVHLYEKHSALYTHYFGDYHSVLDQLKTAQQEVKIYLNAYESKRYKIGNAMASPLEKLKSLFKK